MSKVKFYYIYKITCLTGSWEGFYYYGKHETYNLDDKYFASGRKINDYKKKYGLENCKREIVSYHASRKELNKAEYDVIHKNLHDVKCLNIAEGGHGYPLENLTNEEKNNTFNKISKSNKNRTHINNGVISKMIKLNEVDEYIKHGWKIGRITNYITDEYIQKQHSAQLGKTMPEQAKRAVSEAKQKYWKEHPEAKIRTKDQRENISRTLKKYWLEHEAPNKDTIWINNGINNKQVKEEELYNYLNLGYKLGMMPKKMKKKAA